MEISAWKHRDGRKYSHSLSPRMYFECSCIAFYYYIYKWYSSSIGRIYYINKFILFSLLVVEYIKAIQLVTYIYGDLGGVHKEIEETAFSDVRDMLPSFQMELNRCEVQCPKKPSRHCLKIHNIDISLTLCGKHTAIRHQEPETISGLAAFSFLSQWLVQNFLFLFISFVIWVMCNDKG